MDDFKIDISDLLKNGRRNLNKRVGSVSITTPAGLSFQVEPHDPEVTIAREMMIFLRDRRVLNSQECCDNCIDRSLESIQKIRVYLVEAQQKLANMADGPLFLMSEFLLDAVRQFVTYSERIEISYSQVDTGIPDFRRNPEARQLYFDALTRLRRHSWHTLKQISNIAKIELPTVPANLKITDWESSDYA